MDDRAVERGQRVTPLELFFDLVVVFAITQVTGLLSDEPTRGDPSSSSMTARTTALLPIGSCTASARPVADCARG